jgi:hypothetical protein
VYIIPSSSQKKLSLANLQKLRRSSIIESLQTMFISFFGIFYWTSFTCFYLARAVLSDPFEVFEQYPIAAHDHPFKTTVSSPPLNGKKSAWQLNDSPSSSTSSIHPLNILLYGYSIGTSRSSSSQPSPSLALACNQSHSPRIPKYVNRRTCNESPYSWRSSRG